MKVLFSILLVVTTKICCAQSEYVRLVDSAAAQIENADIFYEIDSLYTELDKDSSIKKQTSLSFKYSDFKRRTLVMVNEIRRENHDSAVLQYFFKNRQLVKIYANIYSANITTTQQFYFNNGKLIFPNNYRSVFDVDNYLKKSKEYLAFKRKK